MKNIARCAGLLLLLAAVSAPSFAQTTRSGNVRIRSSLSARQVYVGQPVRLTVSVFTTTWFTSPINLTEPRPQYAVVQTLDSTPFTRREGRITYAGVTFTYLIYPFQPGGPGSDHRKPSRRRLQGTARLDAIA